MNVKNGSESPGSQGDREMICYIISYCLLKCSRPVLIISLIFNSNGNLSPEMSHQRPIGKTMSNAFNVFYNKCIWIFLLMFAKDQRYT